MVLESEAFKTAVLIEKEVKSGNIALPDSDEVIMFTISNGSVYSLSFNQETRYFDNLSVFSIPVQCGTYEIFGGKVSKSQLETNASGAWVQKADVAELAEG